MKKIIAAALILQMLGPVQMAYAGQPSTAFASVLKTYRVKLDAEKGNKETIIASFAQTLIDKNIGVEEVDAYVKSQLTPKEYQVYKADLNVSMKGLKSEKLTSNEFSQIVSRALNETQSKGLTYSSCSLRTTGVILAVASVVVGVLALLKKKVDKVTEQGLYDQYVAKRNSIDSSYASKNAFLNDPQGHLDSSIDSANGSINTANRDIRDNVEWIDYRQDQIASLQSTLYYGSDLTDEEVYSIQTKISNLQEDISEYQENIDSLNSKIKSLNSDIKHYRDEQRRYADPKVVAAERNQLETWYPQALDTAEKDYKVSLTNMPSTNSNIDSKNAQTAKSKKTLGIIAGAGGAVSLGLILSSTGECR